MFAWILAAYIAGQSGDHISTIVALRQPNLYEKNVLRLNSPNKIILTKLTLNVSTIIIAAKTHKKHPKFTCFYLGALAAVGSYATVHNVREMRKMR